MDDLAMVGGLFGIAFAAATILPAQSEVALAALLTLGEFSPALLVIVASIGNVLGSTLNWLLGLGIARFRDRPWFPINGRALERASGWYRRFGRWSLLLSWMPIIGDPLTIAAGVMRERFWPFLALVSLAKAARYCVVAAVTLNLA